MKKPIPKLRLPSPTLALTLPTLAFLILVISISSQSCQAQEIKINYFWQKPPADSPQKFAPGIISKEGRYELMSAYAFDGREFCFTVTNEQWSHFEIWHTLFKDGKWTEPAIMHFSVNRDALGPAFSPDGKTLYFTAGNWVTHPSTIWYSQRPLNALSPNPQSSYSGDPVKLDSSINSGTDQWQSSIARNGTFVFSSKRPGGAGNYDLYIAEPGPQGTRKVSNLHELNSPADEYSSFIAPDKSYIIFSSQRKGGYGWDDLYISFQKKDHTWTTPLNLGPGINTIHAEFSPQVTPDGKYLFYSKWDAGNKWSHIYWVRIDKTIARLKRQALIPK